MGAAAKGCNATRSTRVTLKVSAHCWRVVDGERKRENRRTVRSETASNNDKQDERQGAKDRRTSRAFKPRVRKNGRCRQCGIYLQRAESLKEDRQSAVVFSCSCTLLFAFTLSVSLSFHPPFSRPTSLALAHSHPPSPDSSPRLCYVIYSFN